ncbi:LssY C-terminal domain-containing protein [Seongchinamella sediminis]|nr:LssY C-terminal domain-containing protein [Seongchinamella sediminis]
MSAASPPRRRWARLWPCLLFTLLLISGCASRPYQGADPGAAGFLQRAVVQQQDGLVISAAVPTAEETIALTGLDLYQQGIQPLWLKVENRSDAPARVITWSIDRDYFAPIEVAYMNRRPYSKAGYQAMERWFMDTALPRRIPAGEVHSGLVYTNRMEGTKGFNLTLIHRESVADFTFFVPLPGFTPDFMTRDFAALYRSEERGDYDQAGLQRVLEQELACCATSPDGAASGAPFNVVLVGEGGTVRRAMLRGGWQETATDNEVASRARLQSYRGREPDAIYSQQRADGDERIVLHLWLSPWLARGSPVWIGQVYYARMQDPLFQWAREQGLQDTEVYRFFARESLVSDIDSAQRYLYQNLWYGGSLEKVGYVRGMDEVPVEEPMQGFEGTPVFSHGMRMVAFLSDEFRAIDEVTYLNNPAAMLAAQDPEMPFEGRQVRPPNDRQHSKTSGPLTVTTAVPSAGETQEIFKVDLYARNIQPVWIEIENNSDEVLQLTPMGIDELYFTPREAANRTRRGFRGRHAERYERRGHIRLSVPPNSTQSGYIFSRVDEGTKSFNVDVLGQDSAHLMTFFVPVPGLRIDHHEVDMNALYSPAEIREVGLAELVAALEAMPCCVRDAAGQEKGDPLNLVFIGQPLDLYYAFMRAGWDETETIYGASLWKTGLSAITGGAYRYSPVSALYVFDRPQDAAMQRARGSIHERNHLRVWMTPLLYQGLPVWIGQISRDIGVRFTRKTITTHKIDPDVDETREFLLEDMVFTQGVKAFGYIGGVGAADYDEPRGNLTGDPYFTDGQRVLMWLSGEPVGLDEVRLVDLSPYRTGVVGP